MSPVTNQPITKKGQPARGLTTAGRRTWAIVGILLALQAILQVDCARRWTPTHDEYWHLPLGLYAWKTGDLRADPINPPLPRLWAALPLVMTGVSLGEVKFPAADAYAVGDAFQRAHPHDHRELFFRGRLMIIPWGLLGGIIIAAWARTWWGNASGILATLLWCSCPLLLGHGALVSHDLPGTVATLAVLYSTMRIRERPSFWGSALVGVLIGLACLTKFSALILLPMTPMFWLILPGSSSAPRLTWQRQLCGACLALWCWWCVIQLGYLSDSLSGRPALRAWGLSYLLPIGFQAGLTALETVLQAQHPVFLNGQWSLSGFRTYYLFAMLYQLPLGLWCCGGISAWLGWKQLRDQQHLRRILSLWLVIGAVLIPSSLSENQLGFRYVMAAVPLGILFAASAAADWYRAGRWRRLTVPLAAIAALLALRYHPHHLSYFNELAGGPEAGRYLLVDSNIDWGQDLHALRDYLKQHPSDQPLSLAYFGTESPSTLGLKYDYPPPRGPVPGRYAVSVNLVMGRPYHLRDLNGQQYVANIEDFGYFRFFQPTARIGYSIDVYHLRPNDVARYWAARAGLQQP